MINSEPFSLILSTQFDAEYVRQQTGCPKALCPLENNILPLLTLEFHKLAPKKQYYICINKKNKGRGEKKI